MKKLPHIEGLLQDGEMPPEKQEQPQSTDEIHREQMRIVQAALAAMGEKRRAEKKKVGRRLVK